MKSLFSFFTDVLHLPIGWEVTRFPKISSVVFEHYSCAVFVGNVFFQLVYYPSQRPIGRLFYQKSPHFVSLIYEADSFEHARGLISSRDLIASKTKVYSLTPEISKEEQLGPFKLLGDKRHDSHRSEHGVLFKQIYFDFKMKEDHDPLTQVWGGIFNPNAISRYHKPNPFVISLVDFHKKHCDMDELWGIKEQELKQRQPDQLKIHKVDSVKFSTKDHLSVCTFFDHLYAPYDSFSLSEWELDQSPALRLVEGQREGICSISLKVEDLQTTQEWLKEMKWIESSGPDHALLSRKLTKGLCIYLVDE